MGQHKNNPTVQLAKEGKLPPKQPQIGKKEYERMMETYLLQQIFSAGFLRKY